MITKVMKHLTEKDLKFFMLLLQSDDYDSAITNILSDFSGRNKICYILLRMPYSYFKVEMEKKGISTDNIYFIDVLSSCYKKQENLSNCLFLETQGIKQLTDAIRKNVCEGNCNMIMMDELNTLLHFIGGNEIQKLANDLNSCSQVGKIKKIFFINKEEELAKEDMDLLIKDLEMYMDRIIDGSTLSKLP